MEFRKESGPAGSRYFFWGVLSVFMNIAVCAVPALSSGDGPRTVGKSDAEADPVLHTGALLGANSFASF